MHFQLITPTTWRTPTPSTEHRHTDRLAAARARVNAEVAIRRLDEALGRCARCGTTSGRVISSCCDACAYAEVRGVSTTNDEYAATRYAGVPIEYSHHPGARILAVR